MKKIKYPKKAEIEAILRRPTIDTTFIERTVANILADVRHNGDAALRHCSRHFDNVDIDDFLVSEEEFDAADRIVSEDLKSAIAFARDNIEKFHAIPEQISKVVETSKGVFCWKRDLPMEKVGLYVPAGSAPLFSTVLMLVIPAKLAGCSEIVITSPPNKDGSIDAATLYAARLCGATRVYKIGGAQAIAALAYGTETVPKVYKIFGPGNQFVTEAKLQILRSGVAIDMPAGPSEVAILADETCVPAFVAADLLAQAEHGPDSQVLLFSNSEKVIDETLTEVEGQIQTLSRKETAAAALKNSSAVLVESLDQAVEILNDYAPEHLIIATADAEQWADKVANAGSVFIGNYSCESAGDYASGTNHTLPTGGAARAYSGVSVASFMKAITYQKLTPDGIRKLGPTVEILADAEGLDAHRNAVTIRLDAIRRQADV